MAEDFIWSLPGLNRHHFTAFGNLLALRNGGQVEPASLREKLLSGEQSDDDSDSGSIDTSRAQPISKSGHDALKRKFLDCLAEFTANRKGGQSVACSAMKEAEDSVTIWITRNEGFQDFEKEVFDRVADRLSKLSCGSDTEAQQVENQLWDLMLDYQYERLEGTFIPNLRASFKECVSLFNVQIEDDLESALLELSNFQTLVFDMPLPGQKLIDRHNTLVKKAFDLRTTKDVQALLRTSLHATPRTGKLWESIYFLGRIRVAFLASLKITHELPSFSNVTMHLVAREKTVQNALEGALRLKDVFNLLKIPLTESSIKEVVGQKWTVMKAEKEFASRQKQKLNVHAEVQMVLLFSRNEDHFKGYVPYFGCSKYCCFMCSHFLSAYGAIGTRGCHGRLFKPWTVPEVASLAVGQAERITRAVIRLQKDLKKELKLAGVSDMKHQKTSVVGGSSVIGGNDPGVQRRKREMEQWQMKAEQERVAERFRSSCEEKRTIPHIFECAKRPITTADYLYMNCLRDEMPDDEEVLKDFGFDALVEYADKTKLLGLYQGLCRSDVPIEDIHKWQVEGSLVANIKEFYYKIPESSRGGYFPWFLDHTDIFDPLATKEEAQKRLISTFFDEARTYLDEQDRSVDQKDLKPKAKRRAFILLAEALHSAHPHPTEENWNFFGFCTCHDEREENLLAMLYRKLLLGKRVYAGMGKYALPFLETHKIENASFTEFWRAHEAGSLIQLMDSKGYKWERLQFPFLEKFLSVPANGPQPSVWSLKQFLEINNPGESPPVPAVDADYGFMNCGTLEETCILMEIYKRLLLKASPLDLHQACLEGKLFEFARRFYSMEEEHRIWMKNFYPLNMVKDQSVEPEAEGKFYMVS
ncbi:hypothetical protein BDZ45DRAFT_810815 [Acephala macrosclerotiorum]|nr:hypothetical protein BDZ45DRAFT_810815 [Acephala macrosclerotiorum]